METTISLPCTFAIEEINIKIVHIFLIIEAVKWDGVKGLTFSKLQFKLCKKLHRRVDTMKIRAYIDKNFIRLSSENNKLPTETELTIDKRSAKRRERPPPPPTEAEIREGQENVNRFLQALRELDSH